MQVFVNLPVKDVDKAIDFFSRIGLEFNAQFTDEKAACMVLSEDGYVMLLQEDFFRTFTKKDLADSATQTAAIVALGAESREAVDRLADTALEAGAQPANDPSDMGFMYTRSFHDLDGHLWEVFWMDESTVER
jgi:predicted lactoylglutathione lyase